MKKRSLFIAALLSTAVLMSGCENNTGSEPEQAVVELDLSGGSEDSGETVEATEETPSGEEEEEIPEGMYRSEITNEIISEDLKDQRPIAVMVDNETYAYPHMGLNQADVVYELMNSTANGRITRLMCIVKDWGNIEQFGSVRSARPSNFILAGEWNAILIHDGGPFYIQQYVSKDYTNNLSGGFARFSNGKATEFTEYVTSNDYTNPSTGKSYDGLIDRIESAGYSTTYNDHYAGPDFTFCKGGNRELTSDEGATDATEIKLPMQHTSSTLKYNESEGVYEYYTYGDAHIDPLDGDKVMSFKNVIIEDVDFVQLDEHGYMAYYLLVDSPKSGYYCTNGKAIEITWQKMGEDSNTYYFEVESGMPLELNTGKTYIGLVPHDQWKDLKID